MNEIIYNNFKAKYVIYESVYLAIKKYFKVLNIFSTKLLIVTDFNYQMGFLFTQVQDEQIKKRVLRFY